MIYKDKNNINESASFKTPNKKEREKGVHEDFILKLMGRIFLTKKVFFGLETQKIVFIVTPTLRIVYLNFSPKKIGSNIPFKVNDILDLNLLSEWSKNNGYEVTFSAPLPKLKSKLYDVFGDVLINESSNKTTEINTIKEEIHKSSIPISIKEWAINNVEEFQKNLEFVKNLLKK